MDLEIAIWREVSQNEEGGMLYDTAYVWILKRNDTHELIYKTGTDPEKALTVASGGKMGGTDRELGTDMYMLLAGGRWVEQTGSLGLTCTCCYILNG